MRESCVLLAPRKEIARIAEIECKKRNWSCKVVYCINNQVAVEFAKKYKENGVRVFNQPWRTWQKRVREMQK